MVHPGRNDNNGFFMRALSLVIATGLIAASILGASAQTTLAPPTTPPVSTPAGAVAPPAAPVAEQDPVAFGIAFLNDMKANKWQASPEFIDRWFATLPAAKLKRELKERKPEYSDKLLFNLSHANLPQGGPKKLMAELVKSDPQPLVALFDAALPPAKFLLLLSRKGSEWRISDYYAEMSGSSLRTALGLGKIVPLTPPVPVLPEPPEAFSRRVMEEAYTAWRDDNSLLGPKTAPRYFTAALAKAIIADGKRDEEQRLTADPFFDAQDIDEMKKLETRLIETNNGIARVEVTFEMFGQRQRAFHTIVATKDGWRIADIESVQMTQGEYIFELRLK